MEISEEILYVCCLHFFSVLFATILFAYYTIYSFGSSQHYLGSSEFNNSVGRGSIDSPEGTKLYDAYRSDRNRNLPLIHNAPKTTASDLSLSPPVDRQFLGEFRSQSAAPSLQSLGPPPGLAKSDRVRTQNTFSDSYLGSDESNMFLSGQRRAATNGVLGNRTHKSAHVRFGPVDTGAVRPAAKTLMDLIKEDADDQPPNRGGYHDDYHPRNGDFREDRQQLRSQMYNRYPDEDDRYLKNDGRYPEAQNDNVSNGPDNFEDPMDHLSMRQGGPRSGYETMVRFSRNCDGITLL